MSKNKYAGMFLRKLQNFIGGKHTAEENIIRIVKHLSPKERKKALKEWHRLIKDGVVLVKPTHYGRQVSINPRKKET